MPPQSRACSIAEPALPSAQGLYLIGEQCCLRVDLPFDGVRRETQRTREFRYPAKEAAAVFLYDLRAWCAPDGFSASKNRRDRGGYPIAESLPTT